MNACRYKGELLIMRKSLKIALAALAFTGGSLHAPTLSVGAIENTASTFITNQWRKRSIDEVKSTINEALITADQPYVIQWGDTLAIIADALGISVDDLASINQISNPDLIIAGSTLYFDVVNQTLTYTEPNGEEMEVALESEVIYETTEATTDGYLIDTIDEWDIMTETEEAVTEEPEFVEEIIESPSLNNEAADQAAADQAAADQAAADQAAADQANSNDPTVSGTAITVEATAYSRNQAELSNFTADGTDLRNETAVIAVDPSVIPLGSTVYIPGFGYYRAADTGGAIVGNRIDIHMEDVSSAYQFGRQSMTIYIVY